MVNVTTTVWMPESNGRGTFHLLIGCLATLSLCVYTALHLNIPSRDAPRIVNLYTKLLWVLMGMFAPELVVFTAWSQWRSAKELTDRISEVNTNDRSRKKVKWTITHSFFAQMGGFVFDTDRPGDHQYVCDSPRLFLTAHGLAVLSEIGRLPVITKEFILDKSKADGLAKAIVILQAGWLILQCIARIAVHLPISFLEINTVAHVVCALIMYFLWWEKPLNVKDPIVLSGEWTHPVAAAMWMFSYVSTEKERVGKTTVTKSPEIESLVHLEGHLRYTQQSFNAQESPDDVAGVVGPNQNKDLGDQPGQPSNTTPSAANEWAKKSLAVVVKCSAPRPIPLRGVEPASNLNLHS
ncbi:hypothetical protein APHAL10511_007611 [Amanita phalloides]|nr:hypothetical protein APHAL10511_007611 [Amanita phalloides]